MAVHARAGVCVFAQPVFAFVQQCLNARTRQYLVLVSAVDVRTMSASLHTVESLFFQIAKLPVAILL